MDSGEAPRDDRWRSCHRACSVNGHPGTVAKEWIPGNPFSWEFRGMKHESREFTGKRGNRFPHVYPSEKEIKKRRYKDFFLSSFLSTRVFPGTLVYGSREWQFLCFLSFPLSMKERNGQVSCHAKNFFPCLLLKSTTIQSHLFPALLQARVFCSA